ncbi:phage integrase [Candidatus Terasakiella magnetica]|nr:phage integrase SAM-like domain-containing protein [Candidatus Terasakiella magnetica]
MTDKKITSEQINGIACKWLKEALEQDEEVRLHLPVSQAAYAECEPDDDPVDVDVEQIKLYQSETKEALSRNDIRYSKSLVKEVLASEDFQVDDKSDEDKILSRVMLRAVSEFYRIIKARRLGDYTVGNIDPLFAEVLGYGSSGRNSDSGQSQIKLSELSGKFIEAQIRDGKWQPISKRNNVPKLNKFIEMVGDIPADNVTRNMIRDYRDALDDMGLKSSTIGQRFKVVAAMYNWAKREGYTSIDNPLKGLAPRDDCF